MAVLRMVDENAPMTHQVGRKNRQTNKQTTTTTKVIHSGLDLYCQQKVIY